MRQFRLLVNVVALLTLLGSVPAGAVTLDNASSDGSVESYTYDYKLVDSRIDTLHGTRDPGGGCTFEFPILRLGPDETAVEARPVELDFESCDQIIEIGTPPLDSLIQPPPEGGASSVELFDEDDQGSVDSAQLATGSRGSAALAASGSATAYYEVRWHDVVHATTTNTRAYLDWSWNGSCVTASDAWGYYWWLALTGWSKVSSSGYKVTSCNNVKSAVNLVHYMNNTFCAPVGVDVDTYVDDSWVRGYYNGSVNGGQVSTWTVESPGNPNSCPNLHYHTVLVKQ